ncbi:MAG TPA: tetratricopeptide repeat protein [Candidatus Dormibacteraeota bacterium]|nr:tetratricopeptide repeat protein [Candidatus Dormibacteraeota bacterium]
MAPQATYPSPEDFSRFLGELRGWKHKQLTLEETVSMMVALANHLVDKIQPQTAQAVAEAAHRLAPDRPEPLNALGRAHVQSRNMPAAVQAYEQALELNPNPAYVANLEQVARSWPGGEPEFWTATRAAVPNASPQHALKLLTDEQRHTVDQYLAAEKARKVLAKLRTARRG